jgi:PAS domain S-box-containing protein
MKKPIVLSKNLIWDNEAKILQYENRLIKLTKSETILLNTLINHINRPMSSELLFHELFDYDKEYSAQTIRIIISKLRKKLPVNIIENIYGHQYIIRIENISHQLQNELDNYLYDVLDQIDYSVVITNPLEYDNPVIYANKKFLEVYQYSPKDIIGKNCRILQHEKTDQANKAKLKEAIEKKIHVTTELINYKKDLSEIKIELTVSPIFNRKSEELKYFIGMQKIIKE